jgi:atypical dual specificity phosphatase
MPYWFARLLFLPTLLYNALLGRWLKVRHWWDQVEPGLWLGALPLRADVARLSDLGITGVINMCREYPGPKELYREAGIEQLWLPTVDFQPPTLDDIRRGVAFIERQLSEGGQVYVHCKAGRARSATIVLCYLMAHAGLTAAQAQRRLLEVRPHVHPNLDQRQVVKQFAASLDRSVEVAEGATPPAS